MTDSSLSKSIVERLSSGELSVDVLPHVGPGTPMGAFFREFWLPIGKSNEFVADAPPLRLMVLGEKLIGFRDSAGRMGVMDHQCPHRCASLFYGRNEESGIRCSYHGWKFDVEGNVLDMPNVPAENRNMKLKAKAYKTCERNSMVWVYMGNRTEPPPLPSITVVDDSGSELEIQMYMRECNWLQGMEGDMDPSHLSFLHHGNHMPEAVRGHFVGEWITSGREVKTQVVDTAWGVMEAHHRPGSCVPDYRHYSHWLFPSWTIPGQDVFEKEHPLVRFWLPMDDTHSMLFQISRPRALVNGKSEFLSKMGDLPGTVVRMADLLHPNVNDWYGRWRLTPNEDNDYLIDRELQRTGNYTGISGIGLQDKAITESMGPIVDRSKEHLSTADLMLMRARRSLLRALAANQRDGTVPEVLDHPTLYEGAMGGGGVLEHPEQDPFEYYLKRARQAGLDPTILR